jgi:hypothetical protein
MSKQRSLEMGEIDVKLLAATRLLERPRLQEWLGLHLNDPNAKL